MACPSSSTNTEQYLGHVSGVVQNAGEPLVTRDSLVGVLVAELQSAGEGILSVNGPANRCFKAYKGQTTGGSGGTRGT